MALEALFSERLFEFNPRGVGIDNLPTQLNPVDITNIIGANNSFSLKDVILPVAGAGLSIAGILGGFGNASQDISGPIDPTPLINKLRRMEQQEKQIAATEAIRRLSAAGLGGTGLAQRVASEAEARVSQKFSETISNLLAQIEIQNQQARFQQKALQAQQKQDIFSGVANVGLTLLSMALL